MTRIKNLPMIAGIAGVLILLFVVSLRGSFQSSLLDDKSYTAVTQMNDLPGLTGTGATFAPFEVYTDRDSIYKTNIDAQKAKGNVGFYFSHIYKVTSERVSATNGGSIDVAFHTTSEINFERRITFSVSYPADIMTYAGGTMVANDFATITAEASKRPGFIDFEILPREGKKLFIGADINPLIRIPFTFTNVAKVDQAKPILLSISDAKKEKDNLTFENLPYFARPVDVLYFEGSALVGGVIENRGIITGEVIKTTAQREAELKRQRDLLTIEVAQPKPLLTPGDVNSIVGTISTGSVVPVTTTALPKNSKPEVTADQTKISPSSVVEGSGDTVFVYLSVRDADGVDDIRQVSIDLSSFGMEKDRALIMVDTGPKYSLYATSFAMSKSLKSTGIALSIPYLVLDKSNNRTEGALSFLIKPAPAPVSVPVITQPVVPTYTAPTTTFQPTIPATTYVPTTPRTTSPTATSSSSVLRTSGTKAMVIEMDLDGNGVVDANDLALFMEAYQQLTQK